MLLLKEVKHTKGITETTIANIIKQTKWETLKYTKNKNNERSHVCIQRSFTPHFVFIGLLLLRMSKLMICLKVDFTTKELEQD